MTTNDESKKQKSQFASDDVLAEMAKLQSQNAQLVEAQEKLIAGYKEAIDDIESWASYASDYFKDKHDLQGCVSAHKALLSDIEKDK